MKESLSVFMRQALVNNDFARVYDVNAACHSVNFCDAFCYAHTAHELSVKGIDAHGLGRLSGYQDAVVAALNREMVAFYMRDAIGFHVIILLVKIFQALRHPILDVCYIGIDV